MKIYVSKDGQQFGPYTVEQLRMYVQQGNFTTEDLACHDGQNWVTIAQVPGFAAVGDSPTTPQQPQAVQQQAASTVSGSKKKKIIFWSSIGGIATLLVAGLLIWLLGGEEGVQDAQEKEAKPVQKEAQKQAVVDKWAEREANPEPYGGAEVLAKIKKAKESGATVLIVGKNQISDLSPLAELTKLKELSLKGNEITDLSPLKDLTNLELLSLDRNEISDLSPLKGLRNLVAVELHENQISDNTPLKGLTNLKGLALHKNQIKDLSPLKGLTDLETLELGDNPIPEDQIEMLKKALPNCKIDF